LTKKVTKKSSRQKSHHTTASASPADIAARVHRGFSIPNFQVSIFQRGRKKSPNKTLLIYPTKPNKNQPENTQFLVNDAEQKSTGK
jgi:hypothetical protein